MFQNNHGLPNRRPQPKFYFVHAAGKCKVQCSVNRFAVCYRHEPKRFFTAWIDSAGIDSAAAQPGADVG